MKSCIYVLDEKANDKYMYVMSFCYYFKKLRKVLQAKKPENIGSSVYQHYKISLNWVRMVKVKLDATSQNRANVLRFSSCFTEK